MGLDQYLEADYYFSDTWEDTADKAAETVKLCGIPDSLVSYKQVTVRVVLIHWRNMQWLHDYIIEHSQADKDADGCYVDNRVLDSFISDANRVIDGTDPIDLNFPNLHYDCKHTDQDNLILKETRNKLVEIVNALPEAEFYYRSNC